MNLRYNTKKCVLCRRNDYFWRFYCRPLKSVIQLDTMKTKAISRLQISLSWVDRLFLLCWVNNAYIISATVGCCWFFGWLLLREWRSEDSTTDSVVGRWKLSSRSKKIANCMFRANSSSEWSLSVGSLVIAFRLREKEIVQFWRANKSLISHFSVLVMHVIG